VRKKEGRREAEEKKNPAQRENLLLGDFNVQSLQVGLQPVKSQKVSQGAYKK